jgi:hypothetical protein
MMEHAIWKFDKFWDVAWFERPLQRSRDAATHPT